MSIVKQKQGNDREFGRFTNTPRGRLKVETCTVKSALCSHDAFRRKFGEYVADLMVKRFPGEMANVEHRESAEMIRSQAIIKELTCMLQSDSNSDRRLCRIFLQSFPEWMLGNMARISPTPSVWERELRMIAANRRIR